MILETFSDFHDFELLDSGGGYRLERWGQYKLARPDPQAIWQPHLSHSEWAKIDAKFEGRWIEKKRVTQPWVIKWPLPLSPGEAKTGDWNLYLNARLTAFKHTGIFAEQAANWEWLTSFPPQKRGATNYSPPLGEMSRLGVGTERVLRGGLGKGSDWPKTNNQGLRILNLFGYTGAATILLAKLGCSVTHVDASKPSITYARENQTLNNLPEDSIRWILDDAVKFVKREIKRGILYDGIIMDPPAFGHAPNGRTWKFAEDFPELLTDCVKLLSPDAKLLLINAYATNTSSIALQNILEDALSSSSYPKSSSPLPMRESEMRARNGTIESGELCLKQQDGRLLSTGIFARWSR